MLIDALACRHRCQKVLHGLDLHYGKFSCVLDGNTNANNCVTGDNVIISTNGYVFALIGGAIS